MAMKKIGAEKACGFLKCQVKNLNLIKTKKFYHSSIVSSYERKVKVVQNGLATSESGQISANTRKKIEGYKNSSSMTTMIME